MSKIAGTTLFIMGKSLIHTGPETKTRWANSLAFPFYTEQTLRCIPPQHVICCGPSASDYPWRSLCKFFWAVLRVSDFLVAKFTDQNSRVPGPSIVQIWLSNIWLFYSFNHLLLPGLQFFSVVLSLVEQYPQVRRSTLPYALPPRVGLHCDLDYACVTLNYTCPRTPSSLL